VTGSVERGDDEHISRVPRVSGEPASWDLVWRRAPGFGYHDDGIGAGSPNGTCHLPHPGLPDRSLKCVVEVLHLHGTVGHTQEEHGGVFAILSDDRQRDGVQLRDQFAQVRSA